MKLQKTTNWQKVKLKDILIDVIDNRGKTPPLSMSGYPMIEVNQLSRNSRYPNISTSKQKYVSKETYNTWFRDGHPKPNDILISTVGTIGLWNLVPSNSNYCIAQNVVALRTNTEKVDSEFLRSYFNQKKFIGLVEGIVIGATQPSIKLPHFLNLEIEIPNLDEQKKISSIISTLEKKIELNNKIAKSVEEIAQAIYKEWFIKFRFPGQKTQGFQESALGKIPVGWNISLFTEIIDVLSGGTPPTHISDYWDGEILFFTPKDAPDSFYCISTEKSITETGLSKCNSKLYPTNTVFITARGTVGKVALAGSPMAMNQSCYALQGKDNISNFYVYLVTKNLVRGIKKEAVGGVFDTITVSTFQRLKVLVPPKTIIEQFNEDISPLFNRLLLIEKENQKLTEIRDLLLPKLMKGEISL